MIGMSLALKFNIENYIEKYSSPPGLDDPQAELRVMRKKA